MQKDEKTEAATSRADDKLTTGAVESSVSESKPVKAGDKSEPANADYPDPAIEAGGPNGPEPTRYGDWERKGILSDF